MCQTAARLPLMTQQLPLWTLFKYLTPSSMQSVVLRCGQALQYGKERTVSCVCACAALPSGTWRGADVGAGARCVQTGRVLNNQNKGKMQGSRMSCLVVAMHTQLARKTSMKEPWPASIGTF